MQDTLRPGTPRTRDSWRRFATVLAATFVMIAVATSAFAAPPNLIISDSNMRAYYSMSAAQIQAYLNTKNGPLKSKSFPRHDGGQSATAAVIIWEACQKWHISPE